MEFFKPEGKLISAKEKFFFS